MGVKMSAKSMGISFFIPLCFNDILIPIIVFLMAKNGTEYNVRQAIDMLTQMFTPFLGAFWVCMHMVKYIDSKDNEIYFVRKRNKWKEILSLYLLYIMLNTYNFIWYIMLNKIFVLEWLHIVIMSFFFMTVAYLFCFLFRSVSLAIVPCFLYVMISVTKTNSFFCKISFYEVNSINLERLFSKYSYFLVAAILLSVVGNIINNHYKSYN